MTDCKPFSTPVETQAKVLAAEGPRSPILLLSGVAGALQYLTFTRLDISYAV
jgi:hypothetical protein